MPRIRRIQSSFNGGVLDPRLAARIDIKAYYDGAEKLDNCICIPQGGVSRRPGTLFIGQTDNIVTRITGQTITAPNGGVAANANDDDDTTTVLTTASVGTANPFVVVHYDLGSARPVLYADAVKMKLSASSSNEFFIQYSLDNITWATVDSFVPLTTTPVTARKFPQVTARYWRLARIGATDLTTNKVTVAEFNLYENTGTVSDNRLIPFSFNTEQNYMLVINDLNITVYKDDIAITYIRVQFTTAQLEEINWTQSADTLIIVHKDVPPQRIVRNSANETIWTVDDVPLTNIPTYDFGSGSEPVWSATRGWPNSVTFHEGRMVFGGSKSRPSGLWMSVTNDFYNFNVGSGLDDQAVVGTLDTDQVNEIRNVVPGRKLQIFTSGAEFVVPTSPITPANFSATRQTQYGSSKVKTVSIDGATLYVQRNGQGFREFLYSFTEDGHVSNSVSQLSSHLINAPVDLAAVSGTNTSETNYVYLVNTAGDIVVLNTLREQEINAWSGPWTTLNGLFRRISALDFDVYFIVRRTVDGTDRSYLEKLSSTSYTDSGIYIASHSSATVTGLDHLEGEAVKVKLGGSVQADAIVSGGSITLSRTPVAEELEVGLGFSPVITTMPVSDGFQDGPTLNRHKRIVKASLNRYQSLGILVNGERIPDRQLDVDTFDAVPAPSDDLVELNLLGWTKKAQITITQEDPVPMTILAIDLEVSA